MIFRGGPRPVKFQQWLIVHTIGIYAMFHTTLILVMLITVYKTECQPANVYSGRITHVCYCSVSLCLTCCHIRAMRVFLLQSGY